MGVRVNKPVDMFGRCWFNGKCSETESTTPCSSDADNCQFNRKVRNNWYCVHANTDNCDLIKSNIHNRGLTEEADRDLALLESMGVRVNKPVDMFGRCWFNGKCSETESTTPCSSDADNCQFNRKVRNNWYCVHANTDNCDLIKSNIHNRGLTEEADRDLE